MKRLPTKVELENLRKKLGLDKQEDDKDKKDESTLLMDYVSSDIKKSCKDPFILKLLKTQIINQYLFA